MFRSKVLEFLFPKSESRRPECRFEHLEERLALDGASIVADINSLSTFSSASLSSNPSQGIVIGNQSFFAANGDQTGNELWVTDGTSAGTNLVADINPSGASSNPGFFVNMNGIFLFFANDGVHGNELWRTDGTSSGTKLVRDINVGAGDSPISLQTSAININGTLYFSANDGVHGLELWKSDGTSTGTVLVKDINPGATGSTAHYFVNYDGTLFFSANDGVSRRELWKSDGTSSGTVLVANINTTRGGGYEKGSYPENLTVSNHLFFFSANDGVNGNELWKSDGTSSGTSLVVDQTAGRNGSNPRNFINLNGVLYYAGPGSTVPTSGLYRSDGTSLGTVRIKNSANGQAISFALSNIYKVNDSLYFFANSGSQSGLFRTDGTSTGATFVSSVSLPSSGSSSAFANVNGLFYFAANDSTHGAELWKSDGTSSGTVFVSDIQPGTSPSLPRSMTNLNGILLLSANSKLSGNELWTSDGTSSGTTLVCDIDKGTGGSYVSQDAVNVGDEVFFPAIDGVSGSQIWKTDGTSTGTMLVADINPGVGASTIRSLTSANGNVYFFANDGVSGDGLWMSDGTSAGTRLIYNNLAALSTAPITNLNGILYFGATDITSRNGLWRSDGTSSGTWKVEGIPSLNPGQVPNGLTNINGRLYFSANRTTSNYSIWSSDGTAAGSYVLGDFKTPNSLNTGNEQFTNVNGQIFFLAATPTLSRSLWTTDGTVAGTHELLNPNNGYAFSGLSIRANVDGVLYFGTRDGLWKTDGTSAGTTPIFEFPDSHRWVAGEAGVNVGGKFYFSVAHEVYQLVQGYPIWNQYEELWSSDGTSSGTQIVDNWEVDRQNTIFMTGLNGKLYYTQSDDAHGNELWESDGTSSGTKLVDDIYSGTKSSLTGSYLTVGPKLYFFANDGYRGNELWVIDSRPLSADIGEGYTVHEGDSLTLHATATGNAESYSWDINGDGVFGDAIGSDPTLTWTQLQTLGISDGPGSFSVRVQVIDAARNSLVSNAVTLTVVDSPPSLLVSGPTSAIAGQSVSFTLSANDPSYLDQSSSFTYSADWNGDGTVDQTWSGASSIVITHVFNLPGLFDVAFTVSDKDGSASAPSTKSVAVAGWILDQGNLIWNGTNGNDSVVFAQTGSQQVTLTLLTLNGVTTSQQTVIDGVTGKVIAYGNAGNDTINASGLSTISTELRGDGGNDTISGGSGDNLIYGDSDGGEGGSDSIVGGNGGNTIYADGSEGSADTITGGNGDDAIFSDPTDGAEGGDDLVNGAAGNDLLDGGTGADTIDAGAGNDVIIGGNGADSLTGGSGEDLIVAGRLTPLFYVNGVGIQQVWNQWRSADPIGLRKNYLDGTTAGGVVDPAFELLTGVTVLNDSMIDTAIANDDSDADWLIADTSIDLVSLGVSDLLSHW